MELSQRCCEHWGLKHGRKPFGHTLENLDSLFFWPEFDDAIRRVIRAIDWRRFLVIVGPACSAKSTLWSEVKRRQREMQAVVRVCEPRGLGPDNYDEQTIYRCLVRELAGERESLKRAREDRAFQVRGYLETCNADKTAVILCVNDAHLCRKEFLILCKRLWDDLYGFDRLLSIVLVAQPKLLTTLSSCPEIAERADVLQIPGLGDCIPDYLAHECRRAGLEELPFDASALDELAKLHRKEWLACQDHPLIINNIASRALHLGFGIKSKKVDATTIVDAMRAEKSLFVNDNKR
jgi:type II secretory pathway predicted ATPase ExeA